MSLPPASDPWAASSDVTANPVDGDATTHHHPYDASGLTGHRSSTDNPGPPGPPAPPGRSTGKRLPALVVGLSVLLAGGTVAVCLGVSLRIGNAGKKAADQALRPSLSATLDPGNLPNVPGDPKTGGSPTDGLTANPGRGTSTDSGDAPASTTTVAPGRPLVVHEGENEARVTVSRITTHTANCGGGFAPANGRFVTAYVSYQVLNGSVDVESLNFDYVGTDGAAARRVPAGFTGCAGTDLPINGGRRAGAKGAGYIAFDGPAHGTITFTGNSLDRTPLGAWRVG